MLFVRNIIDLSAFQSGNVVATNRRNHQNRNVEETQNDETSFTHDLW